MLDRNAATDADQDTALALVLASRRFGEARYLEEARRILADIWAREVIQAGGRFLPTGGNWAPRERYPTIHVAYLAPYAYEVFAEVDPAHPWTELVRGSYEILRFLYFDAGRGAAAGADLGRPALGGAPAREARRGAAPQVFGYDAVPIFWRVALDARWFGRRGEADLRARMLAFPREAFRAEGRLRERYTTRRPRRSRSSTGCRTSASVAGARGAWRIRRSPRSCAREKLDALFERALAGEETPYYLHNWLWLGRALELGVARRYDEPLAFLLGIDWGPFRERFPLVPVLAAPRARAARAALHVGARGAARARARRLRALPRVARPRDAQLRRAARAGRSASPSSPPRSTRSRPSCSSRVQVGVSRRRREPPSPLAPGEERPLGRRLRANLLRVARDPRQDARRLHGDALPERRPIHVCDDSHREAVARLAAEHGARYIAGPEAPRQGREPQQRALAHARASSSSCSTPTTCRARRSSSGPSRTSASRAWASCRRRTTSTTRTSSSAPSAPARPVPNEADLFNHAIQAGRDRWGGAFFVGQRRGVPARGHRLGGRLQPALHHRGHPHEPEAPREGLALGVRGRGPRRRALRRERAELPRAAAPLDARVPADLLQGQPAPRARAPAAPPRRLLRVALVLLLPARARRVLRHAALVPALPPAPALRGPAGPARLPRPAPRCSRRSPRTRSCPAGRGCSGERSTRPRSRSRSRARRSTSSCRRASASR